MVKCILVASPGFVKDQFITYLYKEAVRQDNKLLLENRPKFMLVHSSSGHKYSLKGTSWWMVSEIKTIRSHHEVKTQWNSCCFAEILSDPTVTSRLSDTKVIIQLVVFILLLTNALDYPVIVLLVFMFVFQAAGEVKALEDFYKMLQHEPDRAFYGWAMAVLNC